MLTDTRLDAARQFIWRTARIIDRRRFEHLFEGGSVAPVLNALRAYQNADGGFGHALEPDARSPESQPLHTYVALLILDEIGRIDDPMLDAALGYLSSITTPDGGVPAVTPTERDYPHAPWWPMPDGPAAGSLLPTAGIAGLLIKNRVEHPWIEAATAFCWDAIRSLQTSHPYEIEFALTFLDHAPDRQAAEREVKRLGELVREQRLVVLDPATATIDMTPAGYSPGEFHFPLDYVTRPFSLARRWFSDQEIETNLDVLEQDQRDDGGWMFRWGQWNEAATLEWRGAVTIQALQTLRVYDRIG